MTAHVKAVLASYSEIFFISGPWAGAFMLAVTLLNPSVSAAGLIAVVSAYAFARFVNMDREFLKSGFYTYNPLLVGLSIGYLFKITTLTVFFAAAAGVFTFVLTIMMHSLFSYYMKLPILSLPFVIGSTVAYLAASQYSNLFVTSLQPKFATGLELYLPEALNGLFKSLGAILFLPDPLPGMLFAAVILLSSRIMFVLVVAGYFVGSTVNGLLIGSFTQAWADLNAFNFIWIAIALGGVFLIPSIKSYVLAMIAVAISSVLLMAMEVFWNQFGVPVFAMPFNVVSLSFLYVLGLLNFPLVARLIKRTPEDSLDDYLTSSERFTGYDRTLSLPFSGKWTVWQGFDGEWTHQGSWRYAYDFVITDDRGSTFANDGAALEDYFAWRKPVLAPVRGRVVKVVDGLPDNLIGDVDKANNWGNLIVLHDQRGWFVELSHFVMNSIRVSEGDWVEKGELLGLCGNSGYSPQPHIHLQVQALEAVGSYTLPFSFVSYVHDDTFHANDLPLEKSVVEPVFADTQCDRRLTFVLDQRFDYEVTRNGRDSGEFSIVVKMAPDGTFYFDSGKGQLYFGKHEGTFYFYRLDGDDPFLKALFLALPRLPLACRENMSWQDAVPVGAVTGGVRKAAVLFLSSFSRSLARIRTNLTARAGGEIAGEVVSTLPRMRLASLVELDDVTGFKTVRLGDLVIEKKTERVPSRVSEALNA